jgi:hypothetical protein
MMKRRDRSLRAERWKRAVELAKILFEDQGYHSLYLDDLLAFAVGAVEKQELPVPEASQSISGNNPSAHITAATITIPCPVRAPAIACGL